MSKTPSYYVKASQSTFIVAGVLMLVTFPYFFRKFQPEVWAVLALIVLVAIAAGVSAKSGKIFAKLRILIAIVGCFIASYRAIKIFFTNPEEPLMIFAFWVLQILTLLFFFAIYFSIRAAQK